LEGATGTKEHTRKEKEENKKRLMVESFNMVQ
jgi:hypothetical protein